MLGAQVRQKDMTEHEVKSFVEALAARGVERGIVAAFNQVTAFDLNALRDQCLSDFNVDVLIFTDPVSLLQFCLRSSPVALGVNLSRFPNAMSERLAQMRVNKPRRSEWAALFAAK